MRRRPKTTGSESDAADRPCSPSHRPAGADKSRAPQSSQVRWAATDWTLSRALKTYRFWLLFFIGFFFLGIAEQIAIAHQVYFFRDVGYEPMLAANIYSMFGITFVAGNMCSFSSDRFGREKVFIPGCLLCAVAVGLLFFYQGSVPTVDGVSVCRALRPGDGDGGACFFSPPLPISFRANISAPYRVPWFWAFQWAALFRPGSVECCMIGPAAITPHTSC